LYDRSENNQRRLTRSTTKNSTQNIYLMCSTDITKDLLFLVDWQRIGQRLFRLWHTASLYCRHVTSG